MSTLSGNACKRTLRRLGTKRAQPTAHRSTPHRRSYQSSSSPTPSPFSTTESQILSLALQQVSKHGFTQAALTSGTRAAGYPDVSTNLFPRGVFDLIMYHLSSRRLALRDEVQFPTDQPQQQLGVGAKVRSLTLHRLRANAPVIQHWQQALAIMAQPAYVGASLHELSLLADEIWFLAGDAAVDMSWYSKRASLAALYASSEVYMTTDTSRGFKDTEQFLDRRLDELSSLGGGLGAVGEWVGVSGKSFVNVLRSKGVRV